MATGEPWIRNDFSRRQLNSNQFFLKVENRIWWFDFNLMKMPDYYNSLGRVLAAAIRGNISSIARQWPLMESSDSAQADS